MNLGEKERGNFRGFEPGDLREIPSFFFSPFSLHLDHFGEDFCGGKKSRFKNFFSEKKNEGFLSGKMKIFEGENEDF